MKNIILILSILLISFTAWSQGIEQRRAQIINIIDEELNEISRLSAQRRSSPELLLRSAELNLEKARLFKEKENSDFLSLSPEKRRKSNKASYFRSSTNYFNKANNIAVQLLRKYPRYSKRGEAYYILGYNAKESNKQKTAAKYLSRANQTTKDPSTKIKTQITLAEVYYNEKKFSKAIPLYEQALSKQRDKWWTKDSYNLAWSYYQLNNYDAAISKMKEVYKLSKDKRYIDMSRDVERDLGVFYATSGRVKEGISFYKQIGENFSEKLLRIAQSLNQQGQFTKAIDVLENAEKNAKTDSDKVSIYIEMLLVYEKAASNAQHLNVANRLTSYWKLKKLTTDQLNLLNFQMEKQGATIQRQVVSKTYRRVRKVRLQKAKQAINYFENLTLTKSDKAEEFQFLIAETSFIVGFYKSAFEGYKSSFELAKKGNSKFKNLAMEGMLAALAKRTNSNFQNNVFVYESYLTTFPKGRKAQGIYPRLFNNYFDQKDYVKAKDVLDRYTATYGKDFKTQEAMIAKLMDVDRQKGDNLAIRNWITAVEAKKYAISPQFKLKLQELLTTLQIENVQSELGKGNKKFALVGYHEILKDPYSTKRSKINAKYNLSALYFELGDTDNAYKWSLESMKEMDTTDVVKFSSSFVTIANFLFTSLEFEKSADLSAFFVNKICAGKYSKKDVSFKNGVFIYLAAGNVSEAINLTNKAKTCRITRSNIELAEFEIMRELRIKKDWDLYEQYVEKLARSKRYFARMIDEYLFLKRLNDRFNNTVKTNLYMKKAWSLYYRAKKENDSISITSLDYFADSLLLSMQRTAEQLLKMEYSFPQEIFEKTLGQKFALLEKLIAEAGKVQEVGSGVGIVNSFKLLHDVHLDEAKKIFDFKPEGKSPEYVAAFKKDMNSRFGEKLKQSAYFYKREAKKAITSNSILSQNNFYFQEGENPVKYFGETSSLLMDRGGER